MTLIRTSKYLLLVLVAAASASVAAAQIAGRMSNSATVAEQYLLAAANQERRARGLPLLHRDPRLAIAAAQHAEQMAEHGGISHQFPGEAELTGRGANAGVSFSLICENVAEAPNAAQIHDMWMNSEHHRANLLDPSIDSAGISVIARNGEFFAVEDFARTVPSVSLGEQESAIASLVAKQAPVALVKAPDVVSAARQTCTMPTGYAGSRKPWFVMRFTSASLDQLPDELKSRLTSGRYHQAAVGACANPDPSPFSSYTFAVLLYP